MPTTLPARQQPNKSEGTASRRYIPHTASRHIRPALAGRAHILDDDDPLVRQQQHRKGDRLPLLKPRASSPLAPGDSRHYAHKVGLGTADIGRRTPAQVRVLDASSASLAEPRMRYAIENSRPRSASNWTSANVDWPPSPLKLRGTQSPRPHPFVVAPSHLEGWAASARRLFTRRWPLIVSTAYRPIL